MTQDLPGSWEVLEKRDAAAVRIAGECKLVYCGASRRALSTVKSVAYAEKFHGGISISGIWWSFVFGVRRL